MKKLSYLIILLLILGLALTGCLFSKIGQVPETEQPELPQEVEKTSGVSYDMTTDGEFAEDEFEINGAIWQILPSTQPTGSGVFNAFFRVQTGPIERGYNTDGRPLQFDEKTSAQFTHSYHLNDVPQVEIGGVIYREFQLDVNEATSTPYISLDQFQVWTTEDPELLGYTETTGYLAGSFAAGTAEKVYDLDGDGDTYIIMDYRWNAGSGKRDYRVLVPESDFTGKDLEYVVIFTRHGDHNPSDGGFEEWGVEVYPATKSGYKFNDLNADTIWDPYGMDAIPGNADDEVGLNGWTIESVQGTTVVASATTDSTGFYSLSLDPGIYTIREVQQAGWIQSFPTTGSPVGTYQVDLGNGQLDRDNNFGNYFPIPEIDITKTVDPTVSKVGDEVVYTITIHNTGNIGLENITVTDTLLGDLSGSFADTLAVGASSGPINFPYTIQPGDDDPLLNTVTVHANPLGPMTNDITDEASAEVDLVEPSIDITKTVDPIVSKVGDEVIYTITIENDGEIGLEGITVSDSILGDLSGSFADTLAVGASSGPINFPYTIQPGDDDPLLNTVTVHADPLGPMTNDITDEASAEVDLVEPNTMVAITPNVWETFPGGNVILNITEENTGDVALENVSVTVNDGTSDIAVLDKDTVGMTGDDGNGILDPGETWTWKLTVTIYIDTTFTVTGYGEVVGLGNIITYPDYPDEQAFVEVLVTGATRTLGFWKTHLDFTTYIFDNYLGEPPSIDLGWRQVDSMSDMMGIFWADIAKNSDGSKRSKLCKARVQASWQAMAAILNSSMPGGAPLPSGVDLDSIKNTLGGTNVGAIKALASQLDTYNMSGDDVALDPSLLPTGKADPNGARDIAEIHFADCL